MGRLASFDLKRWIEDSRALLKPPMLNKPIWRDSDFTVLILAGPVVRNDYHIDPFEEFFFQLEGDMVLKTIEDGRHCDVPINQGDVFLLPPLVPHSPQRPQPGSIGLVVERARPAGVFDAFEWYCPGCAARLHRCELHVSEMPARRPALFDAYYDDVANGTCPRCGAPNPKRPTT